MLITKEFIFDSAHRLENHSGKCKNLHGHTYRLLITLEGEVQENGMIMDFGDIKKIVKEKIIEKLDHTYLNEIIPVPTAENIVIWVWKNLKLELQNLHEITLYETPTNFVTYRG